MHTKSLPNQFRTKLTVDFPEIKKFLVMMMMSLIKEIVNN